MSNSFVHIVFYIALVHFDINFLTFGKNRINLKNYDEKDTCFLPSHSTETNCPSKALASPLKTEEGQIKPSIISSFGSGRLANQMTAFASKYYLEREYGVEQYLVSAQVVHFEEIFASRSIDKIKVLNHNYRSYSWIEPFRNYNYSDVSKWDEIKHGYYINVGLYPNCISQYYKFMKYLKKIFSIKKQFVEEAQKRIRESVTYQHSNDTKEFTFVSIHVRRTDYENHLKNWYKLPYTEISYFEKAVQYFRGKYNKPLFLVVSDDAAWCEENLSKLGEDVTFIGAKKINQHGVQSSNSISQVGVDLALLSQANHSILTYGTFGMWGALLSGGETLMPMSHILTKESKEIKEANLPRWSFI